MDYSKSYEGIKSLSDRIRDSAAKGKLEKAGGGLGARLKDPAGVANTNFDEVRARYMGFVQNMFADLPSEQERTSDIEAYLAYGDGIPVPKRNPARWEGAAFEGSMSVAETDENVKAILDTLRGHESGGDYTIKNPGKGATASGAYQMIDSTWKALTAKYGIGTEYSTAKSAPPEIQDAVAGNYVREILLQNNNDVTKVPLVWYTGNAQGTMSDAALKANNGLTAQEYQNNWLRRYNKLIGG